MDSKDSSLELKARKLCLVKISGVLYSSYPNHLLRSVKRHIEYRRSRYRLNILLT